MTTRYTVLQGKPFILYQLDSDFSASTAGHMFETIRAQLDVEKGYSELIAFNTKAELSHINQVDFLSIMDAMKRSFENTGVRRDKTAILASLTAPLRAMTNLWAGYCELDPEIATSYRTFYELEAACEWIKLEKECAAEFLRGK